MIVRGIAKWASVQAPNTTFEPEYSIDLEVSDQDAQTLRGQNLVVKEKDGKNVIKFKRKVTRSDGEENPKPKVVDADAMPFGELIGNGSEVNVQYRTYDWTWAGKSGVSADLVGVQVLKHVAYGGTEFEPVSVNDTPEQKQPASSYEGEKPFDDE